MITRFDHVVIAVQDLDAALIDYAQLGFDIAAGGRHPALGTRNAIVRFGLDYLELLAIEDASLARSSGAFGADLADFLATGSGLIGFALASAGLDDEVSGLARIDLAAEGPFAMQRERADGHLLSWRLLLPGGSPWRKPWPFLIEWTTADAERLRWDGLGKHANGACAVRAIDHLFTNLDQAARLYEDGLRLAPVAASAGAAVRSYRLGEFDLRLQEAVNNAMQDELERRGPGPFCVELATRSLEASAAWLRQAGVDCVFNEHTIDIAPQQAHGARLRLVEC